MLYSDPYYDDDVGDDDDAAIDDGDSISSHDNGSDLGLQRNSLRAVGDQDVTLPSPTFLGGTPWDPSVGVDFDDPRISSLPRILLMGPRRAGKTSIQRVVFHKMSPHETLFRLEATQTLERAVVDHTPLCRFTIWDFPGDQYESQSSKDNADHDEIFSRATALIFVLDAQDEPYDHVLQSFTDTVARAVRANPSIAVEVFVHKVDGELFLSEEAKYDCRRDVMQQVTEELADAGFMTHDAIPISYHLTSIYDHSVFEAFSRVVQRLIPELPTMEHLLNVLVSTCSMEKAYLFDVASKLYISTDSSPVDMQSVELCSDMIDVVLDVSGIYGMGGNHVGNTNIKTIKSNLKTSNLDQIPPTLINNDGTSQEAYQSHRLIGESHSENFNDRKELVSATDESKQLEDTCINEVSKDDELVGKLVGQATPLVEDDTIHDADAGAASAYDSESSSTIHLSNGMVLYLKEVDTMLALVCLTRAENFRKKSLINYNIGCLKNALRALPARNQGQSVR